ncbi:hypothetical protein ACHEXK_05340 [Limnohabitans sp. DCL3]|uniref:hypothetical protein n=1 Tax=Limnohabitans sp. DCL3 TaxID=3374103 RepID=UPI003A8A5E8F
MSAPQAPKTPTGAAELALAQQIHGCRDCQCFWPRQSTLGTDEKASPCLPFGRFGPLPVYSAWPLDTETVPTHTTPTQVTLQAGAPSPALLKGCRKAPAMLVGINPNLKNFAAGLQDMPPPKRGDAETDRHEEIDAGIRTVHPSGDDVRSYMAYHRHLDTQKVLMQIRADDFEKCLDTGATRRWRVAPSDGPTPTGAAPDRLTLGGRRPNADRQAILAWRSDGNVSPQPTWSRTPAWKSDENFVLLRRRAALGTTVAGYLTPTSLDQQTVSVAYAPDGFYTRLATLAQRMNGVPGEDIGLLDMAACASAKWSENAGVDKAEVSVNCVRKNNFALAQLLQSRPQVLFFAGTEAWDLFCDALQANAGGASPATYLKGLNSQVVGCNDQGQADPSIADPLGWLRLQGTPGLPTQDVLRLQWPVSGASASDDSTQDAQPTADVWHCRLVPMAHFSYPDNVTELVHWPAQQHADFLRDFPALAKLLEAAGRLRDPRQEPLPGKIRAVSFGILLLRPWVLEGQANPALPLQQLCEAIVQNHWPHQQSSQPGGAKRPPEDGIALLRSVSSAQWTAAEQRIAPYKLDPMGLAARIAQQSLHAEWGWNGPPAQPSDAKPAKPLGHWPRVATHCTYCEAAGLVCDYRAAPVATGAAPASATQATPILDLSESAP